MTECIADIVFEELYKICALGGLVEELPPEEMEYFMTLDKYLEPWIKEGKICYVFYYD